MRGCMAVRMSLFPIVRDCVHPVGERGVGLRGDLPTDVGTPALNAAY